MHGKDSEHPILLKKLTRFIPLKKLIPFAPQFRALRQKEEEAPFSSDLCDEARDGIYRCAGRPRSPPARGASFGAVFVREPVHRRHASGWTAEWSGPWRPAGCEQAAFHSAFKFDAGTGWPSFFNALADGVTVSTEVCAQTPVVKHRGYFPMNRTPPPCPWVPRAGRA